VSGGEVDGLYEPPLAWPEGLLAESI
jgi:hypothetical protein